MRACVRVCASSCVRVCVCVRHSECVCECVCVRACVCPCVCVCVCLCILAHVRTCVGGCMRTLAQVRSVVTILCIDVESDVRLVVVTIINMHCISQSFQFQCCSGSS